MNQDKTCGKAPFFSIIVPAYNNERELNRCIDSILIQTCTNFELILVNDGSTDATPQICDAYAAQDKRVRVIHKENQGVTAARNDGLFCAAGQYVYYVDADDWIEQGLLQEAIHVLGKPEPPDMFVFGYTRLLENGEKIQCSWPFESGLYQKGQLEDEIYPKMMRSLHVRQQWRRLISPALWDKIIAKSLLFAHYCHDTALFYQEDFVCSYECVYFAESIYFSCSNFYVYDQCSESSMHQRYHAELLKNNRAVAQYLHNHLGEQGNPSIVQQIRELEFDGLITAACQEIRFSPSLWQAARRWKTILREDAAFPTCALEGLSFPAHICVLLFSFRIVYPAMLMIKLFCKIKGIPTKIESDRKMSDVKK